MLTPKQPFVARERELGRLDHFLEQALAGESVACFVAGEAGTGKTALVTEFVRRAQERDAELVVAIGECNAQTGIGDPYLPFREVLALLTGHVEGKLAQGRISPENADRLQSFVGVSGETLEQNGPDLVGIFLPGGVTANRTGSPATRRLAAIWFADIVGYSELSSQNEPAALRLADLLQQVAGEQVERFGGRIVKFLGDAALAEFGSTGAAVQAAQRVSERFATRSAVTGQRVLLRIGVHIGDVLGAPDGDIYGDGVNLAARLQSTAEPGQVLVSEDVWRQLRQRPEYRFTSLGERDLKGSTAPVTVFAVEVEDGAAPESADTGQPVPFRAAARSGGAGPSAGLEQSHIFEQYTNVLRALSAHRPLVLVLDDLQWADTGSIGLLFHLSRRLSASRVLILGAYRPDDVALGRGGERHPLEQVLNELKRYHGDIWVDLSEAQESQGRDLVDALVDTEPNRLGESFRAALYQHTGGHPLFTVELLHNLQEREYLVRDTEGRWIEGPELEWSNLPPRVEGVIEERIGRLEVELRETLSVASVEGESFTAEVVARVQEADARGVVRRLSGELEKQHRLVGAEGVRRLGPQRISLYRFRHNLFQKYLYNSLDEIERSYLHEDIGRILEELYAEQAEEIAVQLARHFEEAGDPEKAIRYLLQAGEQARQAYANVEAIEHLQKALALLRSGSGAGVRQTEVIVRVAEQLGDLLELVGRHEDARTHYGSALSLTPEDDRVARARLHRKTGKTWHLQNIDMAMPALDRADAVLGPEPIGEDVEWWQEWIQVQIDRVWVLYFGNRVDALEELGKRARPITERYGTPLQRALLLQVSMMVALRREAYRLSVSVVENAREYVAASEQVGDPHQLNGARFSLGFYLLWHGEIDPAEEELRAAFEFATRSGDLRYKILSLTYLTFVHRLRGEIEETREDALHSLELAKLGDLDLYIATAECNLAWVALREGNTEEAERLATSAAEVWLKHPAPFPWLPYALLPLIAIRLREDRLDTVVEHARQIFTPGRQPLPDALATKLKAAIAAADAEDAATARQHLEQAVELARGTEYL